MGPEAIDFLRDLNQNNNRDWFNANKKRYVNDLKEPWEGFIEQLIELFGEYEDLEQLAPKQTIFRIYRDTRFSKDKTPYKTHVSAIITPGGRKNKQHPGFYIHLDQGMLMLGGGAYFLDKDMLLQVRRYIANNGETFQQLINDPTFVNTYAEVRGEKNKIIPKEFKPSVANEPLIANKQFYYMSEHPSSTILQDDILEVIRAHYLAAQPVYRFLRDALNV